MKQQNTWHSHRFALWTPAIGILAFLCLYVVASSYYPGGSNADKSSEGFDWRNNFWCDLTDGVAKNGEMNAAQPIALAAMLILCFSLAVFWWLVPGLFRASKYNGAIKFAGTAAMMALPFLFTGLHDTVIHVAGLLGMIALAGTFHGLFCHGYSQLFRYGVFCLALMLCNYFIYETGYLLNWLPVIQKGTFILFLSWVVLINRQTKIRLRRVNAQTDEQI